MTAEQHLAELKRIATATLKACNVAARNEGLVLVDLKRFAALEALADKLTEAMKTATMTRDYADVKERIGYHGKMYLLPRQEFNEALQELEKTHTVQWPMGCAVPD